MQGFLEDLCGVPCFLQAFRRAQVKAQDPSLQQGLQFPLQVIAHCAREDHAHCFFSVHGKQWEESEFQK